MRKIYLLALLFCLTPFLGLAQQPAGTAAQHDEAIFGPGPVSNALPSQIQMNLMKGRSGSDEVWGYAMLVPEANENYGYYYSITGSGGITALRKYPGLYFSAAEFHKPYPATGDDEVFPVWAYASDLTKGFHRLMVEDGTDNNTLSPVAMNLHDMTYDYIHNAPGQEGRMLGILHGKIYLVNTDWSTPYAGSTELLYDPADHPDIGRPVALACNLKGELYFVSISEDGTEPSKLYMFEDDDEYLEDPIEVGELGWAAQHIQTMAFNHHEGDRLYWWQCDKDNNTNLVEIDTETAETTLVAATGNTEISGLFFKFEYRPYTAYCLGDALGEIRLKSDSQYTLTQQDYLPMETVEFNASAEAHYAISRVKVLKHDTEEVLLTIEASDLADGAGSFAMPDCDIDLSCEWEGKENGITYEWTPDDVDGLDINGPAVGSYNELVTFNYMTDFNGYILTGLTAQSGETTLTVRKLSPNVDGKRQIRMPDGEVVITGTYEAIGLEQLENICQYTPAQVPAYTVPSGVTKAELKVRKPGADWTLFADEDWADGEVFDVAGIWQYRAELTNIYGTFTEELSFEVYAAPKGIAIEGTELVCQEGEISLNVVPDPAETDMSAGTFQWYKDGEEIAGATEAQLTINPATTADAGSYTVSYSTGDGLCQFDSEGFEVIIPALPEITWVQPEDGDNAVLISESIELEATPEGGSYSYMDPVTGETVDLTDNIFTFPGAGEFELTYHYEDEYGCANEASVNLNVVQHHFIYYHEKDNNNFPENFTLDGANVYTVDEAGILYGVAGDVMTLNIEVPECNHLVSMDINARDESGNVYTIYNASEPINPYTFTMPAESFFANTYYVTVDAGWAPNEYDINASSSGPVLNCPPTGICGEDVTVEYQNVEDYILCDFAVEGACESLIETTVSLPNQITFTMPDCAVSVFSYYEPISLGQLDDICQWQAPGVPGFATLADYYTSYTYKVQKPGSSEWIDFTEDDWNNSYLFDVAGSWKYRVELTNDYGTFVSAEMIFAVADAPKSIAISGYQETCENSSLFFDVMQTPAEAFLSGSIQWYKDGVELTSETSTVLFIDGYLSDAGTYTVTYTTGYCQLESEPFEVTVNPLPEVAWVEPEDGVTVAMSTESIELQATPEGGTFYYQDPAGTSGALEEITGSTFTFPAVGQYYLAYEYVDDNGCANWIGDRIINVGSEVHLIEGEGGTLQNNTMETVLMPGDGVDISAIADDCMHVTSITVYKTDDHSVTVTSTTDEYIIFTMPDHDVDVVAEYEVNNHYINYMSAPNITGPFDADCGTTVSLDYNNIPDGYILTEFIANGSYETYIPLSFDEGEGECTFTMPDCDVDVTASYEPILLDDVSEFCQWDFPGAPHFTASTYVGYYYNVMKPDGSWIEFDDDDWVDGNNFDMAGTWTYYVVLSNEYGDFPSEQKTFEVIAAPKSITLVAESSYCEGNIIILNVVPDPEDFDLEGGEFSWNQNDMPFDYTTTPTLNVYASTDMSGSWNVEYFPLGGTYGVPCTFTSENIDISVSEMPNVYFETPQQLDTTVHVGSGSLELQASPAGGYYYYEDNNTGEVTELTDNVFTFPGVGEYTVTYTYTNEAGCSADNYRLIHVGYQVTIEGEGGEIYLNNGSTVCNYMPGETVTVRFYNTGCYSFEGMAIAYDDVLINEPVPTTGNTITFTMPENDVTITPNWTPVTYNITYQYTPTTVPNLNISGPTTAACGSRVNIAYKTNVAGYILISLSANDIYGIPLDVVPCEPEQANKKMFTMTDTDVTVTGTYQAIELEQLPNVCMGDAPGTPEFNITAENYTSYAYKVKKSGTTNWINYTADDMEDPNKFDVAGTWEYKVQLTNEYGTFQSEEMSFKVYSVLESLTIQGSNTFIPGGIFQLTADYTPNDAFIAGEFQWFVNGTYYSTTYDPQLSITVSGDPTAAATLAGEYTVIYSTNTATCEFVSDAFTVTLDTSKDVCNIVNNNLNVSLYPNPTSGDAKIVSDHAVIQRVTVYNLMGQTILDEEVNNTETMLHLDGVANGVYMVKVSTENGHVMKKMVVE